MTNDHLGSPRIITDQNGNVTSRRDFLPFGEEIGVNVTQTAGRNSHSRYAGDNTRQKFTGYERDTETSLDYAKARMHSYNHGRFTSPDPLMASANRANPQTWNRYIYVGNNPLKYIDPTGLEWGYYDKGGKRHFRWFDGKAGTYKGRRYQTYTGSMTVNAVGIGWIQLNNNGTYSRILTWNGIPRGTVSPQDAETIKNATGGLLCSGSAGLLCFGDKNSKEFQNAMSGADAVQYASMVKSLIAAGVSLAVIAAIIKSNPDDVAALARAITFKGFSKGSLAEHFGKHGSEFGNITQSQYLKMAKDFAAKSGDDIVEGVEGNFYVKYNQTTRETLVGHIKDREIRTYYVDDGRNADPFQAAIELARSLGGN